MPSYSPVFSQGFIYYGPDTPNNEFLVPAGYTAVVRDVTVYTTIGGVGLRAFVTDPEAGSPIYFASFTSLGANDSDQFQGRVVAPAGWLIGIDVADLGVDDTAYVGGYLLRNTLT